MRQPTHGELQSKKSPEVYTIWRSRNIEPEPCERFGLLSDYIGIIDDDMDYASRFWCLLETLTRREALVLILRYEHGYTLEDTGAALEVTRERIRQIEAKAMRKLRHPSRMDTLGQIPDRWRLAGQCIEAKHPGFAWSEPL